MHSSAPKRKLPPKSYLPDVNDGPMENDADVSRSQTSVDNLGKFILNSKIKLEADFFITKTKGWKDLNLSQKRKFKSVKIPYFLPNAFEGISLFLKIKKVCFSFTYNWSFEEPPKIMINEPIKIAWWFDFACFRSPIIVHLSSLNSTIDDPLPEFVQPPMMKTLAWVETVA